MVEKAELRKAFLEGNLRIKSVSPQGALEWKRVLAVHKAEVSGESIRQVTTPVGSSVLTGGHRVFTTPTTKVESENLEGIALGSWGPIEVLSNLEIPARREMYDLTAEDWHNFVLENSGLVVSNCPDRNYHFRPPAHETTINQFNQVFGYIWEDYELAEFLQMGVDAISAAPPLTPIGSVENLMRWYPSWRTLMLNGAAQYALLALMVNWISEEFSLAGNTLVPVRLPDGRILDVSLEELYDICK